MQPVQAKFYGGHITFFSGLKTAKNIKNDCKKQWCPQWVSCAEPSMTTGRKLNCTVNKLQISTFITLSSSLIHFRGTCKGVDGLHWHCSEAESRVKWICYSGKRMWVLSIAQEISWASVKYFHPIINQGGYLIPIKVSIKSTGASAKIQCDDLKSVTSSQQCIFTFTMRPCNGLQINAL